jgi:uncharacterized protein YecT (DUF1311 family)
VTDTSLHRAYRDKLAAQRAEKTALGLVKFGKAWITQSDMEARYKAALALGRRDHAEYLSRMLVQFGGTMPSWVPKS